MSPTIVTDHPTAPAPSSRTPTAPVFSAGSAQPHLAGTCRSTWPARWRGQDSTPAVHAVEVHRPAEELCGEPELAVCGAVVAVTTYAWADLGTLDEGPRPQDCCPACVQLVRA